MKQPSTLAIIVTYNSSKDIEIALKALQSCRKLVDVVVVDNASSDTTVEQLAAYPWVKVLAQSENLGYAGGNNIGLKYAQKHGYTHSLIVNPDVMLEKKNLTKLIASLDERPDYGVMCPVLTYSDGKTVWYAGAHINTKYFEPMIDHYREPLSSLPKHGVESVESMIGAVALVRMAALKEVGLMDEQFFLYCEESDWSLTFRAKSWLVGCDMGVHFVHNVSSSTGGEGSLLQQYYYTRNVLLFAQKHAPDRLPAALRYRYRCVLAQLKQTVLRRPGYTFAKSRAIARGIRDFRRGQFGKMK